MVLIYISFQMIWKEEGKILVSSCCVLFSMNSTWRFWDECQKQDYWELLFAGVTGSAASETWGRWSLCGLASESTGGILKGKYANKSK